MLRRLLVSSLVVTLPFSISLPQLTRAQGNGPHAGLTLPDRLGPFRAAQFTNLESTSPGLGNSVRLWHKQMTATLFAYNLGLARIPENPASSLFRTHFQDCLREVEQAGPKPVYQQVTRLAVNDTLLLPPDSLHPDGIRAKTAHFRVRISGRLYDSYLILAAQNNHFIKLRYSYPMVQRSRIKLLEKQLHVALAEWIRNLPPLQ